MLKSATSDVIDYAEMIHGFRCEASINSIIFAMVKIGFLIAQILPYKLYTMFGFSPSFEGVPSEQTPEVVYSIWLTMVIFPSTLSLLSLAVKF
jgi:Na+/melibiose symporter-like transporter